MRRWVHFVGFAAAWLAASLSFAAVPRVSIEVQGGGWGAASVRDIQAVLGTVADALLPYFPGHGNLRVSVAFSPAGPRVLGRESPGQAHRVLLNVRDTRWDQFAYQFSHELCHILSNYDRRPIGRDGVSRKHQWLEETLCEAVSLFALRRLSESWSDRPLQPGWAEYAPAFREYAARLLNERHRHLANGDSLAAWYGRHSAGLESNPYVRDKNELLATWVLDLIESAPASLAAIGYLNLEVPAQGGLMGYLAAWYECCPEPQRAFVRRLMSLFAA